MNIIILDGAKQDLFNGSDFYDQQNHGLGEYFFDSLMSDIESLNIYAGIHIKEKSYYKMFSKRFPYAIYYRYEQDIVNIYAILDCRSDPKKADQRLK